MPTTKSCWVLLYLHDWDPVREDGTQPIFPEIHGIYETEQQAFSVQRAMINPEKYWVRRGHFRGVVQGKDAFVNWSEKS